jgi:hypothetical protein
MHVISVHPYIAYQYSSCLKLNDIYSRVYISGMCLKRIGVQCVIVLNSRNVFEAY